MKLKTVLAGAAVACGLLAASPTGASANVMWCVGDPPAQLSTASGANFTVNTQIYVSSSQQHLAQQFTEAVTTAPDGHGGTLVTVEVRGPAGAYATVVVSLNKGKARVSAQNSGSGDIVVHLDVPIA